MDANLFLQNFLEQLEEIPETEVTLETKFRELEEWDSMTALTIIAMVDERYKTKITGDDIRNSETIHDIFERVKKSDPR